MNNLDDTDDFLYAFRFIKGQQDCANGIPHKEGMPEGYDKGYADQYEFEATVERIKGETNAN